ncbi:MAG TPA: hypothetical protein VK524_15530 [Polyangiaceae bacterium]|nr:hypothetical protein [Polyangiaceae bacterium]
MSSANPSAAYQAIDQLLEAGDFEAARQELASVASDDEAFTVLRIKLDLYDGTLEPGAAMQRLIQLMRRDPEWPFAKALYQEASNLAYQSRRSSVSHSHPPPPSSRKPGS